MSKSSAQLLLIDLGNTRLKWATAGLRGSIRVEGDIATDKVTSQWIISLARKYSGHPVVLASVVPKWLSSFRRAFPKRLHVVTGTSSALGLRFHYPKPAEIGADRLAAAVAAHADGHWPVITVSCGTATAFTVLDAKGRLCGGAIAPGLQTQLAALVDRTAQLPAIKIAPMRNSLAKSSKEAIQAGVVLGFQGGVKEILHRLSRELPGRKKPRVLLTGGNAPYLKGALNVSHALRPLLVFEGLRIIGVRLLKEKL